MLTNREFHLQTGNLAYKTGFSFTKRESWVTKGILGLLFTVRRDTPQKFLAELEHKVYNVLVTEREGEEYQNSGARIISVTLTEKGHRLRIISADALKTGNVEEVYPCLEDVYLYWIDRE